jgi:hypothetical protein
VKNKRLLFTVGFGTLALGARAQLPIPGAHYPVGLEGIKGAAMPAPGLQFRDDNLVYISAYNTTPNYDLFDYVQAPGVMWTSDWKIFGARYSLDAMVPIVFKRISNSGLTTYTAPGGGPSLVVSQDAHRFGVGDIKLEPVRLSWEWKQLDFTIAYALWLPTGDYDQSSLVNLGDGTWTHMVTLGVVWYPDQEKTWAFSVLNHYEFNCQQVGTTSTVSITPGGGFPDLFTAYRNIDCSVYSMEWGVSKTICPGTDLGIVGYYQKQYTDANSSAVVMFNNAEVAGIGPEMDIQIPHWDMSAKLRYAYEFANYHHPEGNTIDLEIVKKF